MPRYKLTIEYDGTGLVGWQRQDNGPSVQQFIEEAVQSFSGEKVTSAAAGRTDAGVHALGQVCHIEMNKDVDAGKMRDALNFFLKPFPVSILASERAADDFHARFSAKGRSYLYRILNRRPKPALDRWRVWWIAKPLDVEKMHEAAQHLVGTYDLSSFRAAECQANSPIKTMDLLRVSRVGEEVHIIAEAQSFLHRQIRNITGSLKHVGEGRWSVEDFIKVRDARDRRKGGQTAPAHGLYFTGAKY